MSVGERVRLGVAIAIFIGAPAGFAYLDWREYQEREETERALSYYEEFGWHPQGCARSGLPFSMEEKAAFVAAYTAAHVGVTPGHPLRDALREAEEAFYTWNFRDAKPCPANIELTP